MVATVQKFKAFADSNSSERLFNTLKDDRRGFEAVSNFLRSVAGIHMPPTPKNLTLMASRLSKTIHNRGFQAYAPYLEDVKRVGGDAERELIQQMTTNTTHFFREDAHFAVMKKVLIDLAKDPAKRANRELRVWCAAASTGQEPYSMAINICDTLTDAPLWDIKFLASDIDLKVLRVAATGVYSVSDLEKLPDPMKRRYFRRLKGAQLDGKVVVNDSLKNMITFAQFNLMSNPYPFEHQFDLVFCRNVLIYFERETSAEVVQKIANVLRPGGHLFVGHSESGVRRPEGLESVAAGVWRKSLTP